MSDKTEDPTPKRLRKAHEEGDSGSSSVLSQAIAFLVAVALTSSALAALSVGSANDLIQALARASEATPSVTFRGDWVVSRVVAASAPLLLAVGIASLLATLAQTGGTFAPKKLVPDWSRLDPVKGFLGLFSFARGFAVVRAILAAAIVIWIVVRTFGTHAGDFARLSEMPQQIAHVAERVSMTVIQRCAIVFLAIGFVDFAVTKRSWKLRLRMSKADVKREHKESEGDPETKAQRERARKEMLSAATLLNVRRAQVVVVNPTHLACALEYDRHDTDAAPTVVASGEGDFAKRIVEAARAYGVPIIRDVPLARALIELEVGSAIPEALYETVAEILREAFDEAERSAL